MSSSEKILKFVKQISIGQQQSIRIIFLSVAIVVFGMLITILLTNFEIKRRQNIIEYQYQLVINEVSRNSHLNQKEQLAQREFHRINYQNQYRIHSALLNKDGKKRVQLEQIKNPPNYVEYNERPDFALGTAGAQILSTGRTQVMMTPFPQWFSIFGFNGISSNFLNGAHRAIQPSAQPGECFAFTGRGELIIKMIKTIFIDAVTIEHISAEISPDGNISSAPGIFHIYGMTSYNNPKSVHLGTFNYEIGKHQSRQTFQLDSRNSSDKSFPIVKFVFDPKLDDHNYTCVYRVRVHGSLIKSN